MPGQRDDMLQCFLLVGYYELSLRLSQLQNLVLDLRAICAFFLETIIGC